MSRAPMVNVLDFQNTQLTTKTSGTRQGPMVNVPNSQNTRQPRKSWKHNQGATNQKNYRNFHVSVRIVNPCLYVPSAIGADLIFVVGGGGGKGEIASRKSISFPVYF